MSRSGGPCYSRSNWLISFWYRWWLMLTWCQWSSQLCKWASYACERRQLGLSATVLWVALKSRWGSTHLPFLADMHVWEDTIPLNTWLCMLLYVLYVSSSSSLLTSSLPPSSSSSLLTWLFPRPWQIILEVAPIILLFYSKYFHPLLFLMKALEKCITLVQLRDG